MDYNVHLSYTGDVSWSERLEAESAILSAVEDYANELAGITEWSPEGAFRRVMLETHFNIIAEDDWEGSFYGINRRVWGKTETGANDYDNLVGFDIDLRLDALLGKFNAPRAQGVDLVAHELGHNLTHQGFNYVENDIYSEKATEWERLGSRTGSYAYRTSDIRKSRNDWTIELTTDYVASAVTNNFTEQNFNDGTNIQSDVLRALEQWISEEKW